MTKKTKRKRKGIRNGIRNAFVFPETGTLYVVFEDKTDIELKIADGEDLNRGVALYNPVEK